MSSAGAQFAVVLLSLGAWAPFTISLVDSAFVPLAHSVDLLIAVVAAASLERGYQAAAMCAAGSTLGSAVLYEMSRRGGRALLERRFATKTIARIRRGMMRHGALLLMLPTLIPGPLPMRPMVIAAGAFRMGRLRFLAVIAVSRAVRFFAIAFVAGRFGEPVVKYLNDYGLAGLVASVVIGGGVILWRRFGPTLRGRPPAPAHAAGASGETA